MFLRKNCRTASGCEDHLSPLNRSRFNVHCTLLASVAFLFFDPFFNSSLFSAVIHHWPPAFKPFHAASRAFSSCSSNGTIVFGRFLGGRTDGSKTWMNQNNKPSHFWNKQSAWPVFGPQCLYHRNAGTSIPKFAGFMAPEYWEWIRPRVLTVWR